MTAAQSLDIYNIFNKYFKNEDDARILVSQIEVLIENKSKEEAKQLATKEDLAKAETKIILWVIGYFTAIVGVIIAILKF